MKITIKDVAKAADVSIATVSRVINGKDKVKYETRLKIEQAVERLQFKPDMAARSMIIKQSRTIGLIVPQLGMKGWGTLADFIQDSLMEQGYTLFIGSDKEEESKQERILHLFQERKVDGIIMGHAPIGTNKDLIKLLRNQGIPFVTMGRYISEIPYVACTEYTELMARFRSDHDELYPMVLQLLGEMSETLIDILMEMIAESVVFSANSKTLSSNFFTKDEWYGNRIGYANVLDY
ncbi:LacI family DNA-binding transcriptional regulator [Paenibacillus sp. Marseille-Q4541]|uniref:LacI family DNA-binding transcriptional regulator n=1 Tax=Paenibacillus sp. Marseille-Q4541 TaxID=2831522 RepID=UPI001BADD462|nr:LacI family DNA-binding transcriptional regulator [Paenibacillus sp. Marseille-Q4541]